MVKVSKFAFPKLDELFIFLTEVVVILPLPLFFWWNHCLFIQPAVTSLPLPLVWALHFFAVFRNTSFYSLRNRSNRWFLQPRSGHGWQSSSSRSGASFPILFMDFISLMKYTVLILLNSIVPPRNSLKLLMSLVSPFY